MGFGHSLEMVPVPVRQGLVMEDMDADGPLGVIEDGLHDDARMPGIVPRRIVVGQRDMNGLPGDIQGGLHRGFHRGRVSDRRRHGFFVLSSILRTASRSSAVSTLGPAPPQRVTATRSLYPCSRILSCSNDSVSARGVMGSSA